MSVTIKRVTYARVAHDATPKAATSRPHDPGLDVFLEKHVEALQRIANQKNSCPANFIDPNGKNLFQALKSGGEQQFLAAASDLTLRLVTEMNGSTKPGLLVCLQFLDGTSPSAAVLKLQVVAPNAANLETLDNGEELLSAVTDVMDAPGDLQKGALIDDHRPGSEVIMGDVANKEAQYFPRAFGISIEERPSHAAIATLEVIKSLSGDHVEAAARDALPTVPAGPIVNVLEGLAESVTELQSPVVRSAILDALDKRPRPVRHVDTATPMVEVISASGVTIKVPITSKNRVSIEPDPLQGGYVITIRVDDQPIRETR